MAGQKRPRINRDELKSLYEAKVRDGIQRWQTAVGSPVSDDHAFLLWAFDLVLSDGGIELAQEQVIEACERDKTGDLKIDGTYIDNSSGRIFLVQSKHWDPTRLVGDDPFIRTWESLSLLSDLKRVEKANKEARQFYNEFAASVQTGYKIVLAVVTSGRIGDDQRRYVNEKPKTYDFQIGLASHQVAIEFKAFGLKDLLEVDERGSADGTAPTRSAHQLRFDSGFHITPGRPGGYYKSLYATMAAEELVRLRETLKDNLYKLNYRGPLDSRVTVNSAMQDTIQKIPEMFHILNNGVTAICEDFEPVHGTTNLIKVTDIQIVNGCQTTETLYRNSTRVIGHPEIKVNFRLVTCAPASAGLIAKATNQQTRLRAADFVTLDQIQEELHQQFAGMQPKPWYYQIKPRSWKNVMLRNNRRDALKFIGEDGERVIALEDAAQRGFAFLGEPIIAAQRTGEIFRSVNEAGFKETVFPPGLSAYQLLLPWIIFLGIKQRLPEFLISKSVDVEKRDIARVWLEHARLTALSLVGDALREHYGVAKLEYFSPDLSRKLLDSFGKWSPSIVNLSFGVVWNQARNSKQWFELGPRAVFRRPTSYTEALLPSFLTAFQAVQTAITGTMPSK
jgi:hypothetical protein